MNRPDYRDAQYDQPWRRRAAPPAAVSLLFALAVPAVMLAALLPGPAALLAGVALGFLAARR